MKQYILNGHILFDFKGKFDVNYKKYIPKKDCTINNLVDDIFNSIYGKESDKGNFLEQEFGYYPDPESKQRAIETAHHNIKLALIRGYETPTQKGIARNDISNIDEKPNSNKTAKKVYDYGIITQIKKELNIDLYVYLQDNASHIEKLSCLQLLKILYAVEKCVPISKFSSDKNTVDGLPYANRKFFSLLRKPSLDYISNEYSESIANSKLDFLMHLIADAYNIAYVENETLRKANAIDENLQNTSEKPHEKNKSKTNSSKKPIPYSEELTYEHIINIFHQLGIEYIPYETFDENLSHLYKNKKTTLDYDYTTYANSSYVYYEIRNFWTQIFEQLIMLVYCYESMSSTDFKAGLKAFHDILSKN